MAGWAASGRRTNSLPWQGEAVEQTRGPGVDRVHPGSVRLRFASDDLEPGVRGGVVLRDGAGQPCAFGGEESGRYWVRIPDVGTYELSPNGADVFASASADTPRRRLVEGYYGTALPLFAQAVLGYEVLHASAVLVDGAAVAFCAWTGVGKSTIGSGLSERGFDLWADDALALATGDQDEWPLVSAFLPYTRGGAVVSHPGDVDRVPLRAVFLLERVERDFEGGLIEQRPPADTVAALLSHGYRFASQSSDRRRRMVETYLAVAARAQILSLYVKHDLAELPQLLDRIESMLALSTSTRD
jgi:hypothetical protein